MGRPLQPLIEINRVIEIALAIIEEHGLEKLNMRRLGAEMEVNPASLYHHFRDKEQILDAVADYVVRSIKMPRRNRESTWEELAIDWAQASRAVIVARPNVSILLLSRRSSIRPAIVHDHYESILSKLCAVGFSEPRALLALVTLEMLAAGSAFEEAKMGPETQFARIDPQKHPTLHKIAHGPKLRVAERFEEMCHVVLLGLKAEQEGMEHASAYPLKKRMVARRAPRKVSARNSPQQGDGEKVGH